MLRSRNSKGQLTKGVSILITEQLRAIAKDQENKVKKVVREELENTYKDEVFKSYVSVSKTGREIKNYNDTHKRQKKQTYRHTGLFINSIKAKIDGHTVKIVIEDNAYDDGASTTQVYEWLTKGTTETPAKENYPYIKKQGDDYSTGWAKYNPTPKHHFERLTMARMEGFLDSVAEDVKNGKYLK